MKSITPFLWFDHDVEEVAAFYTSTFPGATVQSTMRGPDGAAVTVEFEIAGQRVVALNGGPQYELTEAFSLAVQCENQDEVDHYWAALTADGGEEGVCGWLKDRYGLSWQVVPVEFLDMFSTGDPEQIGRLMTAMRPMRKLDIATLRAAYEG